MIYQLKNIAYAILSLVVGVAFFVIGSSRMGTVPATSYMSLVYNIMYMSSFLILLVLPAWYLYLAAKGEPEQEVDADAAGSG